MIQLLNSLKKYLIWILKKLHLYVKWKGLKHSIWVLEAVVLCFVVMLILVGVVRIYFSFAENHKADFEKLASSELHHMVKVKQFRTVWKGFYPEMSLEDGSIFEPTGKVPFLKVERIELGINVVASLWQRKFVTSSITVSGVHLNIKQLNSNAIDVNGIPFSMPASDHFSLDITPLLQWLRAERQMKLENIEVDWTDLSGRVFQIRHIEAALNHTSSRHQLTGVATLLGKTPAKFRFVLNAIQKDSWRARFYLSAENLNITPWIPKNQSQALQIQQGTINHLEFWAAWRNNQWQTLQTVLNLKDVQLQKPGIEPPLTLNQLAANIAWQRQENGFNLTADKIKLVIDQLSWPLTKLQLSRTPNASTDILKVDQLILTQLQSLAPFVLNHSQQIDQLAQLEPTGNLSNIWVRRKISSEGQTDFSAGTTFSKLKISAWNRIPAVDGLEGNLFFNPAAGEMNLKGGALNIFFPALFDHDFKLRSYQGHVSWRKQENGFEIEGNNIQLEDKYLKTQGHFRLWLPVDEAGLMAHLPISPLNVPIAAKQCQALAHPTSTAKNLPFSLSHLSPYLQASATFSETDISHIPDYIPTCMGHHPGLYKWLSEAFLAGEKVEGGMVLKGALSDFPFGHGNGRFEVMANVKNMDFNYRAGWPHITGVDASAYFENRSLNIQTSHALIMGHSADQIHAQIPDLTHATLSIQGKLKADMQDGVNFIHQSPLKESIGAALEPLVLKGPMNLDIGLQVPLHNHKPPKILGQISIFPNSTLDIPDLKMHLTDLQGKISFSENSLFSDGLMANWLGQPIQATIKTQLNQAGDPSIQIPIQGSMPLDKVQSEYGAKNLKDILKGELAYTALLQVQPKALHSKVIFRLDSDLKGVAVQLPDPLKKSATEKQAFHFEIQAPDKNSLEMKLQYAKKVSAIMKFLQNTKKAWQLQAAGVHFGETMADLPGVPGWSIEGYIPRLSWPEVSGYIKSFGGNTSSSSNFLISSIDLDIDELIAFDKTFEKIYIQAFPRRGGGWEVSIDSPDIVGTVSMPKSSNQTVVGNFERFVWKVNEQDKKTNKINPGDIPPLNLTFKQFIKGDKMFGNVSLQTQQGKNVLYIQQLKMNLGDSYLMASGNWSQMSASRQESQLKGNFHAKDLGTVLQSWGVTQAVAGGEGDMHFDVWWPDAMQEIEMGKLNGTLSIDFKKGRIIQMSGRQEAEMGIGRILNILSLQSLPRRLIFDFSDLLSKGFAFDRLKGDVIIKQGNAVTEGAYLKGPIAKVEMNGRIGLGAKDYALKMMITPYLTSSVPLAATLIGGPIAGAAAWLGNQIVGRMVDHVAMRTYWVTGGWDEPVVSTQAPK